MSSSKTENYESPLDIVFGEKEKSRLKLGQLWQDNSRLEEQVKGNKKERERLEVLARGNREELERLQLLILINREKLLKANDENEKLDKELETAVRKKVEPSVASDKKKRLEAKITQFRNRIAECGKNLADHEKELATMDFDGVAREMYEAKKQEVEGYKEIHRKSIGKLLANIDTAQARLSEIASGEVQKHGGGGGGVTQPSTSSSSRKRHSRDDDDVVFMEEKRSKMSVKEQEKIVPKVIKTEEEVEETYPAYSCPHCPRHLTSAATLVSHLVKHFPADTLLPCPFPGCNFHSKVEGLTRHARSRHTGEKLFPCSRCHFELPSYSSLVDHQRKHSNKQMYQCNTCLRFSKVDGPGCYFCRRK
eukprot:GFUD01006208.1.p1 GENE.GFUD01006208.1~~GFUD01006208.1.p1  ORF type:complete len:364 (+),score=117.45 GFUD01006208.1:62-1153(+)